MASSRPDTTPSPGVNHFFVLFTLTVYSESGIRKKKKIRDSGKNTAGEGGLFVPVFPLKAR